MNRIPVYILLCVKQLHYSMRVICFMKNGRTVLIKLLSSDFLGNKFLITPVSFVAICMFLKFKKFFVLKCISSFTFIIY